ncbi:MAG: hypothetical protein K0A95_10685 [Chromatiales bacterium]|nr:hypothetical protein [Gammaproteobacteria bacterium]MBW6477525.1 hypothetical protein [Chromatiales bacterium]
MKGSVLPRPHALLLLAVILVLGALYSQASAINSPVPSHQSALWVLANEGISRFDGDTGERVLVLPDTRQAQAFALDETEARVWVLQRRALQVWDFDGSLRSEFHLPPVGARARRARGGQ